jgi:hypothetical protein
MQRPPQDPDTLCEELLHDIPPETAVLGKMPYTQAVATLPVPWRFLVMDGSHIQGPGAHGAQYRLHICMDLVEEPTPWLKPGALTLPLPHSVARAGLFQAGLLRGRERPLLRLHRSDQPTD